MNSKSNPIPSHATLHRSSCMKVSFIIFCLKKKKKNHSRTRSHDLDGSIHHLASPHRFTASPHRTAPHLTAPHLTSPHLTSPHLTSPHLTSPHASPKKKRGRGGTYYDLYSRVHFKILHDGKSHEYSKEKHTYSPQNSSSY